MNRNVQERVSAKTISESDLRSAIEQFGDVTEPPSFWLDMANDQTYPAFHRAVAICQFFKRHMRARFAVVDLAGFFTPDWINAGAVVAIRHLKGEIPVEWNPGETVLAVRLFPKKIEHPPVLYLRLSQTIDAETFVRIVTASPSAATTVDVSVLEAACGE